MSLLGGGRYFSLPTLLWRNTDSVIRFGIFQKKLKFEFVSNISWYLSIASEFEITKSAI